MKMIGMFVVIIFCCYIGKYFSDREQKKLTVCDELCGLLKSFNGGIAQRIKLDDIINTYSSSKKCKYIKGRNKKELCDCLEKAGYKGIDGEMRRIVRTLLSELGKNSDTSAECEKCQSAMNMINEIREKCVEDSGKKKELYKKLGFISGLMLCVLFV